MNLLFVALLTVANASTSTTTTSADHESEVALRRIFEQIPSMKYVEVKVTAGVAILRGSVLNPQADEAAIKIAKSRNGIVYVLDEIAVNTDVDGRIVPALDKMRELTKGFFAMLPLLVLSLAVLLIAWLISRIATGWSFLYRRLDERPFVGRLVRRIVRLLVLGGGILLVLEILGITALVGALLGTAGVAGLAIGFAFKDIIENYLAGVMLSLRHPFRTGDLVQMDGIQGKLVRLTSRDTVLMTLDGNHIRIPNADVFKAKITNFTLNPLRRFDFTVGIGTQESLIEVRKEALEVLGSIKGIMKDPPPKFAIDSLGDSSVVVHLYAWVEQTKADFMSVRTEAVRRVKVALEDNGHDLPEPIYRVVLRQTDVPAAPRAIENVHDDSMLQEPPMHEAIDEQIAQDRTDTDEKNLLDS